MKRQHFFISIISLLITIFMSVQLSFAIAPPMEGVEPPPDYEELFEKIGQSYQSGGIYRALQERKDGLRDTQPSAFVPILLGRYSNSNNYYQPEDFQTLLFGDNPTGSMSDFYDEISYNQFSLDGTAFDWVTAPENKAYYVGNNNGLDGGGAAFSRDLAILNDPLVDFGQFDNDGPDGVPNSGDDDGFVDVLVIVHTGGGAETGDDDNIWSHRWSFSYAGLGVYTTNDPAANGGFILANDYIIQPETNGGGNWGEPLIEIGVFCHEFGHALGLPDLYDTDDSSSGIGNWGLMASGSYNGNSKSPAHMCAWSKEELGWVVPVMITEFSPQVEIPGVENEPVVFKLWINGELGQQYFLVENRRLTGFDSYLPADGLCIWHVDNNMYGNTNEDHKLVDLEAADGRTDMDNNANSGDGGDVYPGYTINRTFGPVTNPNSSDYSGNPSFVLVSNISDSADPMSADMNVESIMTNFMANPATGHASLMVQFMDLSEAIPAITTWAWDFTNDGTVDSNDQYPFGIYPEPGHYTVRLETSNGLFSQTLIRENYIRVFDGESAIQFDGANGSAHCLADPTLNLTELMTIEAWIRPTGWQVLENIVNKDKIAFLINGENGTLNNHSLAVIHRTSGSPIGFANTADGTISLNEWQHVAFTYDGNTSQMQLYINGLEQTISFLGGQPSGDIIANNSNDLYIGSSYQGNWVFEGGIDEVRVWNIVRSSAEIAADMGHLLDGDEAGLVAYWQLNEGNGTFLTDGSGHNNHGQVDGIIWTEGFEVPNAIEDYPAEIEHLPNGYSLGQNYPNPLFLSSPKGNPLTTIGYTLPAAGQVTLKIFNIAGQEVKTLVNGRQAANFYEAVWDGRNRNGERVSSGVYFYQLQTENFGDAKRMVLMK